MRLLDPNEAYPEGRKHSLSKWTTLGAAVLLMGMLIWGVFVRGGFAVGHVEAGEHPVSQAVESPSLSRVGSAETITSTTTSSGLALTLLHTNDTWGYTIPCG